MRLLYPWFLLGLFAVAVPVVIHLLQLRRPRRVLFTNTAVIRQVELLSTRHRKVQQWLILLARVAAVAALVLVFCQPFIPAMDERSISGVDVVVDNSFSMQLSDAESGSLLDKAVGEARRIGNEAGNQLRLLNAGPGLLSKAAYDNKLDELRPTSKAVFVNKYVVGNGFGSGSSTYLFSDFQKTAFSVGMLNKLATDGEIILVPLSGREMGNIYVDSIWVDDAFLRMHTNVAMHIRLRNGGRAAISDCPVKVFLGNRQVAAFRVTVGAGQAVASVVQVQLADEQLALGRVVTEDVPVMFDNTFYFTLRPAAVIRVLEIGGEPMARQVYDNEPLFNYSFTKVQNIDYGMLRQANLVLLSEVDRLDAGLRDALRGVVKRGGSVVLVPTAHTTARQSYEQLFRDLGLGTVQWEDARATPELREVTMPNVREPFFRDVFGAQSRTVTMPRVAPVLRWSRTGMDILRLRDGESYLANFTSGAGQVYVFSAPFAKEYSDFTAQALFVPVMYRMAMLSYKSEQLPAYKLTQEAVSLHLPAAAGRMGGPADATNLKLVKDSLTLIPGQRVVGQEVRLDLPVGMNEAGFYQVHRQGKVLTTLAFNQDRRESELAAYSAEELRQLVGPNRPNVRVVEAGNAGAGLAKFRDERTGTPLWRYFLALALLALLAEALLVRFGKRATATQRMAVAG
ncbi:BatA domain-containing protein [Hymenobacter siberiensis]|uniref:BatA domain-containing protein n=1 Tax=Hymenobacter siberiensis TaxID=2848396 RepID=UPI001C1DF588|nr:BatA domain-containing protein [Hymenobacter siberiensis]MBU6121137.1 BatA domain-containing protein [Hymenobacter siberiensis]